MERDDQLAELLMRWDDAIASGRPLTPEAVCNDTPDLKHDFTQLLRDLGKVDPVLDGRVDVSNTGRELIDAGRFVPISFGGEGGLGVVYVAEDLELKRSVALKWMKPIPSMDERSRNRFMNEAEITGKLEHPGVAPVYGAGKDPHGKPYYAMRFIQGKNLADEIKTFHTNHKHDYQSGGFARLLRKFVAVCQTIAYAHARGVIHRDIKPGNVMIGPYGETLVVDWGLAKTITLADPDGTVDTGFAPVRLDIHSPERSLDGQVKGSPTYMSPEQARGENDIVGPRSDIYSLGATLYVLLTGKSLYPGRNAAEILHDLKQRAPVLNPDNDPVPKGLLAICRKAMAREPGDRYANALFIADDIDRWLADEPVSVYRDSLTTRTRRWVRNHRTMVAATAAMLLLGIVAMIVVIPILSGKNRDLAKANKNLEDSNRELKLLSDARKTDFLEYDAGLLDMYGSVIATSTYVDDPHVLKLRKDAIRKYKGVLTGFLQRNRGRSEMREELAVASAKLGECEAALGQKAEAIEHYRESARLFEELLIESPKDRDFLYGRACALAGEGVLLNLEFRFVEAEPILARSRQELEEIAKDPTPIRLAQYSSTSDGSFVDTPAQRLAGVTLVMIECQSMLRKIKQLNRPKPEELAKIKETNRQWINTSVQSLTQGKPPSETDPPAMVMALYPMLIEQAQMDPDPKEARRKIRLIMPVLQTMIKKYPGIHELRIAKLEAEIFLADTVEASEGPLMRESYLMAALRSSEELLKLDLAVDFLGLRARVLVQRILLAIELGECQRARWFYGEYRKYMDIAHQAFDDFIKLPEHPPEVTIRLLFIGMMHMKSASLDGNRRDVAEKLALRLIQMLEKQPQLLAGEPYLEVMLLNLHASVLGLRQAQNTDLGDLSEKTEKLYKKMLKQFPNEDMVAMSAGQMYMAQAMEAHRKFKNLDRAEELIKLAKLRFEEAGQLGLPKFMTVQMTILCDVSLSIFLGQSADWILEKKPDGDPVALEYTNRAIVIIKKAMIADLKTEEWKDPELKAFMEGMQAKYKGVLKELETTRDRAAGKKPPER